MRVDRCAHVCTCTLSNIHTCMHAHAYACTYTLSLTHAHTCTHMHLVSHMLTYMSTCVRACVHMHAHVCTCTLSNTHTCTHAQCTQMHTRTCSRTHTLRLIHTHIYTHKLTLTHTHTHLCTLTHTRTHTSPPPSRHLPLLTRFLQPKNVSAGHGPCLPPPPHLETARGSGQSPREASMILQKGLPVPESGNENQDDRVRR